MKRLLLAGAAMLAASTGAAQAQMQWTDFPPAQSRLSFDAPGLSPRPSRAFEGVNPAETKKQYRSFGYIFNRTTGDDAVGHVYVYSISADMVYFTNVPDFDGRLPGFYREFKDQAVTWTDAQRLKSPTPLGETEYRRFTAMGKSCLGFGGLYGRSSSIPFASGNTGLSGTEQIMGYYCAQKGYTLSEADAQLVLSRLSFDGLGKAQGSPPQRFAGGVPGPAAAVASAPAPTPAPAAQAAPAAPKPAPAKKAADIRKMIVLWEGKPAPLSGTITIEFAKTTSRLEIQLPGQEKTCLGVSALNKDGSGTWAVECPDGSTGTGVFHPAGKTGAGGYTGDGTDNKGARVSFSVAARG